MSRVRWVAALVMAVLLGLTSPLTVSPAQAADPPRVLVVGDSISQGLEGDFTWRYRLAQHFAGYGQAVDFVGPWAGTHVIPAALPAEGQTLPPVHDGGYRPGISFDSANLAQWGWQMNKAKGVIQQQAYAADPDYLLLELGFNDLGWFVSDANGLWTDLGEFLREVNTAAGRRGHQIRVAVGTVPQREPIEGREDLPVAIDAYNARVRSSLATLAGSVPNLSLAVADIGAAYNWRVDAYDGLHPGIRGEHTIAGVFASTLANAWSFGGQPQPVPNQPDPDLEISQPAGINVQTIDGGLRLTWSHVFGAGGYRLYERNISEGATAFTPLPLPIGADSWTLKPLPAGMQAEYYVDTERGYRSADGHSAAVTGTVGGTTPPKVPEPVQISDITQNEATVTWTPVAGANRYRLVEVDARTLRFTNLPIPVAGPSFRVGFLGPGRYYRYGVAAMNGYLTAAETRSNTFRTKGIGTGEVVTMGDSYAAGTGASNEYSDCYRSGNAAGDLIMGPFITYRYMYACAGATMQWVEAQQLDQLAATPDHLPRLILLIVGGNDIGWDRALLGCHLGDCTVLEDGLMTRVRGLETSLTTLYRKVRETSPGTDLVVGGYPMLLEPGGKGCDIAFFTDAERDMTRRVGRELNAVIDRAAKSAGAFSAVSEIESVFDGHGICNADGNDEWINRYSVLLESFHPNARGQIAYAEAFLNAFRTAAGN